MSRNPSPREEYIRKTNAPESAELQAIREALTTDSKEGINISSSEGALLQFFIKTFSVKTILELGTLYGYSTLWMAEALPENGQIISIEKNKDNFLKAKGLLEKSPHYHKIKLKEGDAIDILKQETQKVDMVFIDADKSNYENYLNWAEENLNPNGLIVGDNTFLFGNLYGEKRTEVSKKTIEVMNNFNSRLSDKTKYHSVIVPTTEGMTVAFKK